MVKENPRTLAIRARRKRTMVKRIRDFHKQQHSLLKSQLTLNPFPNPSSSSSLDLRKHQSPLLPFPSPSKSKKRPTVDSLSGYRSFSDHKLPPLPPMPPSPQLLRRAVSDPSHLRAPVSDAKGLNRVTMNSGNARQVLDEMPHQNGKQDGEDSIKKTRDRAIGAKRIEGDRAMIKINCQCGLNYQLMISEDKKKCYYKIV